jgi:hypothetical protein
MSLKCSVPGCGVDPGGGLGSQVALSFFLNKIWPFKMTNYINIYDTTIIKNEIILNNNNL